MRHLSAPPPIRGGALLAALLIPLALGACSQSDEGESPAPAPSLTAQAMPTSSADGQPLTEGQWSIEETAGGASASFGGAGDEPMLRLVCIREERVLRLAVAAPAEEPQTYTISVGDRRAAVPMEPTATGMAAMLAEFDPAEPIVAAFSDPAGTIEISAPDEPALRVPGHAGIARVIQSCS